MGVMEITQVARYGVRRGRREAHIRAIALSRVLCRASISEVLLLAKGISSHLSGLAVSRCTVVSFRFVCLVWYVCPICQSRLTRITLVIECNPTGTCGYGLLLGSMTCISFCIAITYSVVLLHIQSGSRVSDAATRSWPAKVMITKVLRQSGYSYFYYSKLTAENGSGRLSVHHLHIRRVTVPSSSSILLIIFLSDIFHSRLTLNSILFSSDHSFKSIS